MNIDAIVIEILPKDNIPQYFFLKPNIDYINNADILINKEITILQYPDGNSYRAFGTIISKKKNNEFAHSASTLPGSSGSPIFLRNSTKVIGIQVVLYQKIMEILLDLYLIILEISLKIKILY